MLLPELQSMASSLGISGTARMRKGELIAAIQERQSGDSRVPGPRATDAPVPARVEAPRSEIRAEVRETERHDEPAAESNGRAPRRASRPAGPPEHRTDSRAESHADERPSRSEGHRPDSSRADSPRS